MEPTLIPLRMLWHLRRHQRQQADVALHIWKAAQKENTPTLRPLQPLATRETRCLDTHFKSLPSHHRVHTTLVGIQGKKTPQAVRGSKNLHKMLGVEVVVQIVCILTVKNRQILIKNNGIRAKLMAIGRYIGKTAKMATNK